jgi:hypothetical protein
MRLTPILIVEGRKEDLRKKYTEKFKEYPENLDFILGISDLADTNFKYADFVLRELHPNTSDEEIEDAIELVKDFDRFKQSLEVKDINQYDLDGLKSIIDNHKTTSKSQLKKIDTSDAKKLYEDDNLLIVKPLTYESSCKYGSGTRWCTTSTQSHFKSYTEDGQSLYYVILKKFDISNKFYKIAIHMKPNLETWYDATDEVMSDREKEVFNLGAPKVIQTIRKNYEESLNKKYDLFFKNLFNFNNYKFANVSSLFKTTHKIGIEFQKPELISDMPNHATIELNISVDEDNIDQYLVMITYDVRKMENIYNGNDILFTIGYSGDDFEIKPEFDFGIENVTNKVQIYISNFHYFDNKTINNTFDEICRRIESQVINKMKENDEFMLSITDGKGKTVWIPNRSSYGFTFKRNSGLIKKLIDYLDSGKEGTKLDFLVDVGSLDKMNINGKPQYSHKNKNDWKISSEFRGQLSGFFNSAKLAGILDYDKKGNQFILKKGKNFDKFKEGQLEAI